MATKLIDVQVGDIWTARISGNHTQVRIDHDNGFRHDRFYDNRKANIHLGFTCTNLTTGKQVQCHIQRLRRLVSRKQQTPGGVVI